MQVVGREAELALLAHQITTAVAGGAGRSLFVRGAPGVGKTALVSAALAQVAAERPGVAIARGRCQQSFGAADPYLPFVDALRDLSTDGARGPLRREAVAELLGELAPYWLSVIPLVGSLLSAGFSTAARLRGKPKTAPSREALFVQYLELTRRLAEQAPLVLWLDDLHQADPGSVELLAHLCRGITQLPVVVIGSLQSTDANLGTHPIHDVIRELEREQLAAQVEVGELRGGGVQALAEAALGGPVTEPLRRFVEETAGGNPLFVGELCRLLGQSGAVTLVDGAWQVTERARALEVPRSAEAALGRRLERLEPDTLQLLQYASVQGNEFSSMVLARLLDRDELTVLDRLAEVERKHQLVQVAGETTLPGGEVATVFRFATPLLQALLYRQVMGKRRILLHRRAGEVLESLFEWNLPLVAGELAWHFQQGRQPEAAERYARMAEESARQMHAPPAPEEVTAAEAAEPVEPSAAPTAGPAPGVFVGREQELDLLTREVALAVELGAGRSVFVEGAPGAGKTTLVAELLERLARDRPRLTIARGRCLPSFGSADPYLPFVEALRDISDEKTLGFTETESFAELLADIAPFWIQAIPVVGNLLSATLSTVTSLRSGQKRDVAPSREAFFAQYLELIRRLAARSPLVLFFDDLHWADQSSVALLGHLVRGIERLPVVILGTLRPHEAGAEQHPLGALVGQLEREELARRVALEELSGDMLGALVAAELGGDVSEPLLRWIAETAGGNPLFASELARLLRQSGAAVEERGEWHLTDRVRELGVPRSAEAVIEKRIQRLPPEALRMLQYASVQGNEFNSLVLSRLLEQDELEVLDRLAELDGREQLVRVAGEVGLPEGDTATSVHFRHALVQTVLYRQLAGKRRILLHRRAGEVLESLYRGREEQMAGALARHFHQGRVRAPAYRYARLAADGARRVYAHWEAEELYRIALQHTPDVQATVQVEERLGNVYDTVGYYDQGIAAFTSALQKCDDPSTSLRLRRKVVVLERKGGRAPGPELLQRVRALLAEAAANPEERCHLLLEVGRFPGAVGAIEAAAEALDIAGALANRSLLAYALEQYAMMLIFGGRPHDALPHLARALAEGEGDPLRAARNHNLAGIALAKLGRYDAARREFESMLETVERIGDPNGIGVACSCSGLLLIRLGRFAEAEAVLQRARVTHERRDRSNVVQSLFNLAERARQAGELALAAARYAELQQRAAELGHWAYESLAHAGEGLCLLERGDRPGARLRAERALAVLADREQWFENRDTLEIFLARMQATEPALVGAAEGRLALAARALEGNDVYLWARVELERVELLLRRDPAAAGQLLARVRQTVATIQSPPLHAAVAAAEQRLSTSVPLPAATPA